MLTADLDYNLPPELIATVSEKGVRGQKKVSGSNAIKLSCKSMFQRNLFYAMVGP